MWKLKNWTNGQSKKKNRLIETKRMATRKEEVGEMSEKGKEEYGQ